MKTKSKTPAAKIVYFSPEPVTEPLGEALISGTEQFDMAKYFAEKAEKNEPTNPERELRRLSLPAIYTKPKTFSRAKKVRGGVLLGGTSVENILVTVSAVIIWTVAAALVAYVVWFGE